MGNTVFLSRSIDYLGDLGAKLRDLQGYRTLVHELIQNADDVPSANQMTFDVRQEALVVDNDVGRCGNGAKEAQTSAPSRQVALFGRGDGKDTIRIRMEISERQIGPSKPSDYLGLRVSHSLSRRGRGSALATPGPVRGGKGEMSQICLLPDKIDIYIKFRQPCGIN